MAASIAPGLSRLSAFPSQQNAQDAPPLQLNPGPERVAHDDGSERPKVYQRRKKGSPATEEAAAEVARPDSSEEVDQVSSGERTCVECSTSRTPLWRRGPAGPKSLCNACGLRYKKRSRERSFNPTQMKANALTKEKEQSQGKDVFFLHRKFAGTEEAEAATLLMALSCGVSFLF